MVAELCRIHGRRLRPDAGRPRTSTPRSPTWSARSSGRRRRLPRLGTAGASLPTRQKSTSNPRSPRSASTTSCTSTPTATAERWRRRSSTVEERSTSRPGRWDSESCPITSSSRPTWFDARRARCAGDAAAVPRLGRLLRQGACQAGVRDGRSASAVAAPTGMFITAERPTRSVRPWPGGGPGGMIVVGEEHETGSDPDTSRPLPAAGGLGQGRRSTSGRSSTPGRRRTTHRSTRSPTSAAHRCAGARGSPPAGASGG